MKKIILLLGGIGLLACALYAADEISVQAVLQASKNNAEIKRTPATIKVTWTGEDYYAQTLALTTNPVALAKGDVGDCGYAYFRNAATTGVVVISFDTAPTEAMRLKAGEFAVLRLAPGVTITDMRAWATTNTAKLDYTILED